MRTKGRSVESDVTSGSGDGRQTGSTQRGFRVRRFTAALLIVFSTVVAGCTPAEIERSMEGLATSFEDGAVERGLSDSIFLLNVAIPIIGMRLRAAFG